MKQLMLGNAAIARGLYEAGCRFVSAYPGTPSTEITEFAAGYDEMYAEWAPNEKVAMESAFGASLAGARSFCAMKHVGLNVAADPLFTAAYVGVNAGLVVCVADDPAIHSSQNEQDSRHYAEAAKLPMLEPADSAECLAFTKRAFELSETYDTPVMLRTVTRIAHSQSLVETSERVEPPLRPYVKDAQKYVAMPAVAVKRHVVVEKHIEELRKYTETCDLNREELRDPTAHAEMLAIREAARKVGNWRLADCCIYVTLEPCPMCAGAISQARLGKLVFGAFDEERGCAGSLYRICEDPAFPWFTPSVGGVLEGECKALLDVFFQRARR